MDLSVVYDVQHNIAFGPLVIVYLFLAGLSAGLFLISSLSTVFEWEQMRPFAKPVSALALATIIPGGLCLLLDLGQPLRALNLFFEFNPLSVMSWGSYILLAYSLITSVYVWLVWNDGERQKMWGKAGIVAALALGLYTGVLIAVAPGHPLWNSAIIPVLFLVSGGVAALSLINVLQAVSPRMFYPTADAGETLHSLKVSLVSIEIVLIASHLIILGLLGASSTEVVKHLLTGTRQFSFLGVQIVLGTLIPLAILLFVNGTAMARGIAGFLSLTGVMALRYNIVVAGQELPTQGTFLNALEGDRMIWIYIAILLALAVVLGYMIPAVLSRYCKNASAI